MEHLFPQIQVKAKKNGFIAIWDYIRPEFEGLIRADKPFFVWPSSAQISVGARVAHAL